MSSEVICVGHSIEGDKVDGSSRKPLIFVRQEKRCGAWTYLWKATFNVKALIVDRLGPTATPLYPDSIRDIDKPIECDRASVLSYAKKFAKNVARGSHTHQTNKWHFAEQTAVKVDVAHQELINAILKRHLLESSTPDESHG